MGNSIVSKLGLARARTMFAILVLTLGGCASRYGTAVGSFGQMEVSSTPNLDVRILRFLDFQRAFPSMPAFAPANDSRLSGLLADAPSGRANQGQFVYRTGQYFLSYRCGDVQKFQHFRVTRTARKAMKVSCS